MAFLVQNGLSPGFAGHFKDAKRRASYYILPNLCYFISTSTWELDEYYSGHRTLPEKLPLLF